MFKISKKLSVEISIAITVIAFAALTVLAATAWNYHKIFFPDYIGAASPYVVIFTYAEIIFAYTAVIFLFLMLYNIKKSVIFVPENTANIRAISWCCFAECILFLSEGLFYKQQTSGTSYPEAVAVVFIIIAVACAFMGIILRVVKNIFEQATALKSENDFTI